MKREEFTGRLREQTDGVRVSPALAQRTLRAAGGKEKTPYMKKKISLAVAFALLAVTMLCAAAIAAANRLGMLDFVDRFAVEHYIPEDAQDYVLSDVLTMDSELVTITVRELYYDGRTSRMTIDIAPKDSRTLLVGTDVMLSDPWGNMVMYNAEGELDEAFGRSVYEHFVESGYENILSVNAWGDDPERGTIRGMMDYTLNDDGVLTIYRQDEYADDLPVREMEIGASLIPYDTPVTPDSYPNIDKRIRLEERLTVTASVNATSKPAEDGAIADTYVSTEPAEYESVGVRVDRVLIEVKPQEIYATVEYTVTDREVFEKNESGLFFEFIDPEKEGEYWMQRLTSGLSGGGMAGPVDNTEENPTKYRQTETLGKNELHDTYALRAFECWEKERFETHTFAMRPATAEDMEK